jgi:thiamine biosynthesis lipoprotein
MNTVTLARNAMATRFEIVLHGDNPVALRAAGEEALTEIEKLEDRLSLFRPHSEIAHVNARAAREPVRVTPEVFRLLERAYQLHTETQGAFDITIAPLMRAWGFQLGGGKPPLPEVLEAARAVTGMRLVHLDPANFTVRFDKPGVMMDLGAIGKGYAVEAAAGLLREAGVESALLHGGTSTLCAIGHPPNQQSWDIAIETPPALRNSRLPLGRIPLRDTALSVSAVWGKFFEWEGRMVGHVIDPRTGQPAGAAALAAVQCRSATDSDALSTALLVRGVDGLEHIAALRPGLREWVVEWDRGDVVLRSWPEAV